MNATETATWERDGETFVNSGEISGMDPPRWSRDPNFEEEIIGDSFTAYYKKGDTARAAITYYVVQTMTWNQPEHELTWVIEYVAWVGDVTSPDGDVDQEEYSYESASPFFYSSPESALETARGLADADESHVFL